MSTSTAPALLPAAAAAADQYTDLIDLNTYAVAQPLPVPTPVVLATREQWLLAALDILRPIFEQHGATIPHDVKVTCGWAAGTTAAIGQCFARCASAAGVNEMFISPVLDDSARVLDVLVHEAIHASDDCASGHKGHFAKVARALDLQGALTATTAGPVMKATCNHIVTLIGEYPHAKLNFSGASSGSKKQPARMLKHSCNECGAIWRVAGKWAVVACPCCTSDDVSSD